jgi:hypothetical protein
MAKYTMNFSVVDRLNYVVEGTSFEYKNKNYTKVHHVVDGVLYNAIDEDGYYFTLPFAAYVNKLKK